ncbi:MAG: ABC transporter ATP-binding protein [Acidisphaera sp.]|nr:ABC transporter ATP-binding protein [Acidisphaera sp.]
MSSIRIENLRVAFGSHQVLSALDLAIADGEFVVLLGPSGCGKSTLLNAIAGLIEVADGRVLINERDVTQLEPKQRGLAMVFQSYALYPNMSVYGNLAFALKVAGVARREIDARVRRAADTLALTPLLSRRPIQLSGGQRQRVAIGRALVRDVDLFLFDEPLSNLDAQLRAELRVEIKRLHKSLRATMIYVTHDQVEALTLADRIVVMRGGVVQQIGDPETIYDRPANVFVAGFLGSPPMNLVPATLALDGAGRPGVSLEGRTFPLGDTPACGWENGRNVTLGIRPERIRIGREAAGADVSWNAPIDIQESLGSETLIWARLAGRRIAIKSGARLHMHDGESVPAGFGSAEMSLFDSASGDRL